MVSGRTVGKVFVKAVNLLRQLSRAELSTVALLGIKADTADVVGLYKRSLFYLAALCYHVGNCRWAVGIPKER